MEIVNFFNGKAKADGKCLFWSIRFFLPAYNISNNDIYPLEGDGTLLVWLQSLFRECCEVGVIHDGFIPSFVEYFRDLKHNYVAKRRNIPTFQAEYILPMLSYKYNIIICLFDTDYRQIREYDKRTDKDSEYYVFIRLISSGPEDIGHFEPLFPERWCNDSGYWREIFESSLRRN